MLWIAMLPCMCQAIKHGEQVRYGYAELRGDVAEQPQAQPFPGHGDARERLQVRLTLAGPYRKIASFKHERICMEVKDGLATGLDIHPKYVTVVSAGVTASGLLVRALRNVLLFHGLILTERFMYSKTARGLHRARGALEECGAAGRRQAGPAGEVQAVPGQVRQRPGRGVSERRVPQARLGLGLDRRALEGLVSQAAPVFHRRDRGAGPADGSRESVRVTAAAVPATAAWSRQRRAGAGGVARREARDRRVRPVAAAVGPVVCQPALCLRRGAHAGPLRPAAAGHHGGIPGVHCGGAGRDWGGLRRRNCLWAGSTRAWAPAEFAIGPGAASKQALGPASQDYAKARKGEGRRRAPWIREGVAPCRAPARAGPGRTRGAPRFGGRLAAAPLRPQIIITVVK